MKNFWIVISLIALLLGLGLYYSSHGTLSVPSPTASSTPGTIVASTTTEHVEDKENRFVADIETPRISGHANAEAFNALAKVYVDRATEDFQRNVAESNMSVPETFKGQNHAYIAQAEIFAVNNRYVSVVFHREYSMISAAHPFHVIETLVYDLDKKEQIELSDIFVSMSDALAYIAAESEAQVRADLNENGAGDAFNPNGLTPDEANFRIFALMPEGITFFFSEYQVAPYIAGAQKAELTWKNVRPLLTPEFKLLAN